MKLTKADRQNIVNGVMTEKFKPRFEALRDAATIAAKEWLRAEHPRFFELSADPKSREYLYRANGVYLFRYRPPVEESVGMRSRYCYTPTYYGVAVSESRLANKYSGEGVNQTLLKVDRPGNLSREFCLSEELDQEYEAMWEAYIETHKTISNALEAFSTRERLVADLPGLAKYLPSIPPKNDVAILVPDLVAQLEALGVDVK